MDPIAVDSKIWSILNWYSPPNSFFEVTSVWRILILCCHLELPSRHTWNIWGRPNSYLWHAGIIFWQALVIFFLCPLGIIFEMGHLFKSSFLWGITFWQALPDFAWLCLALIQTIRLKIPFYGHLFWKRPNWPKKKAIRLLSMSSFAWLCLTLPGFAWLWCRLWYRQVIRIGQVPFYARWASL